MTIITMTWKKWLLVGLPIIAIIAVVILSWPSKPKPVDTQAIVDATAKKLEAQYQGQIKEKDLVLKDLKSRLIVSERKYKTLAVKYAALQKEKEDVKPPITNAETRERLTALGFAPLSIK